MIISQEMVSVSASASKRKKERNQKISFVKYLIEKERWGHRGLGIDWISGVFSPFY